MKRRRGLALAGGVCVAVAGLALFPLFELASGRGLGGADPILDLLVWFVPIIAIIGVILLTTALLLPPRKDAQLPYRPL